MKKLLALKENLIQAYKEWICKHFGHDYFMDEYKKPSCHRCSNHISLAKYYTDCFKRMLAKR